MGNRSSSSNNSSRLSVHCFMESFKASAHDLPSFACIFNLVRVCGGSPIKRNIHHRSECVHVQLTDSQPPAKNVIGNFGGDA